MPTKEEMLKFSQNIENIVSRNNINYIEAIVDYCTSTGLEIEVAATLINQNLKSKIQCEAIDMNMLKIKSNKLPL